MKKITDTYLNLKSFNEIVEYLNYCLNKIEKPYVYKTKEKLIHDFNNLSKPHHFSNWNLIGDYEDDSALFLIEKKFNIYLKRIPLCFYPLEGRIEMKKTLLVKKELVEKDIEVNYYFHLKSFYGFSIKCLKTHKYIGFSLTKNGFSCYFEQEDFPSMFDEKVKRESTIFFDKAITLHNFFEDTNNQTFMSHIFKLVFEKKNVPQQEIDNLLIMHDINFEDVFDTSYIFDIPENFYV